MTEPVCQIQSSVVWGECSYQVGALLVFSACAPYIYSITLLSRGSFIGSSSAVYMPWPGCSEYKTQTQGLSSFPSCERTMLSYYLLLLMLQRWPVSPALVHTGAERAQHRHRVMLGWCFFDAVICRCRLARLLDAVTWVHTPHAALCVQHVLSMSVCEVC